MTLVHSARAADAPATQPTAPTSQPAAAAADTPAAPSDPVPDKIGAFMTSPTAASVPGYTKPDPDKASVKDLAVAVDAVAQSSSRNFFAANFTWTLIAGFLVMFMQAGFALVETGLIRAKNAGHTISMNFLVYALGMFGFFICGFAFMCGGVNGANIGGPASLGGMPTLNQMVTVGDGWGIMGKTGFFLTGAAYDAQAIVWFLFMMVFMDTTATIPTGALAERWSLKSFFFFSIAIGAVIYPIYGCWVWGGLARAASVQGRSRARRRRLCRLLCRSPSGRRHRADHLLDAWPAHRQV